MARNLVHKIYVYLHWLVNDSHFIHTVTHLVCLDSWNDTAPQILSSPLLHNLILIVFYTLGQGNVNPVTVENNDIRVVIQSLKADADSIQSWDLRGRAKNKGNQSSCSKGGTKFNEPLWEKESVWKPKYSVHSIAL